MRVRPSRRIAGFDRSPAPRSPLPCATMRSDDPGAGPSRAAGYAKARVGSWRGSAPPQVRRPGLSSEAVGFTYAAPESTSPRRPVLEDYRGGSMHGRHRPQDPNTRFPMTETAASGGSGLRSRVCAGDALPREPEGIRPAAAKRAMRSPLQPKLPKLPRSGPRRRPVRFNRTDSTPPQPRTAPAVRPAAIRRWANRTSRIRGRVTSRDAAAISPQGKS